MAWWHKLIFWKTKSAKEAGWFKKIVGVHGEVNPGLMKVDIGTFDQDNNPIPVETITIEIKITPELRPTANRILAGVHTEEDEKVIELVVLKLI